MQNIKRIILTAGLVFLLSPLQTWAFTFVHNDKEDSDGFFIIQTDSFCSGQSRDCFKTLINFGESDGCDYKNVGCNCTLKADACQSFMIIRIGGDFARCNLQNVPANAKVIINKINNEACNVTMLPVNCQTYSVNVCSQTSNSPTPQP